MPRATTLKSKSHVPNPITRLRRLYVQQILHMQDIYLNQYFRNGRLSHKMSFSKEKVLRVENNFLIFIKSSSSHGDKYSLKMTTTPPPPPSPLNNRNLFHYDAKTLHYTTTPKCFKYFPRT